MDDNYVLLNKKQRREKLMKKANVEMIKRLGPYEQYAALEMHLKRHDQINFHAMLKEPLGCYFIKSFLASTYSLSKATFIADVDLYRKLKESARHKASQVIFQRFIMPDSNSESSVFDRYKAFYNKFECNSKMDESITSLKSNLYFRDSNNIGFYDRSVITRIAEMIRDRNTPPDLFDEIYGVIFDDIRFDIFPRFLQSPYYKNYIRTKSLETKAVSFSDFESKYTLGHGAFGFVNAAQKKNSGHMYAIKCLSKKHVIASEQTKAVLNEKDFLSKMDSHFVTCLNYSFSNKDNLFLVLDLMPMGDLKQLLNRYGPFSEELSRFYAAEILLGLQHIHERGIIYRDIKLENILLDSHGHLKISDLGLSVQREKVKGYAGTPGYTAPEVVKGEYYTRTADFFSYGVIVYRLKTGRKPFGEKMAELDRNVVKIEPHFSPKQFSESCSSFIKALIIKNPDKRLGSGPRGVEEIMEHKWFETIDFGLLEAGYVSPPWVPKMSDMRRDDRKPAANHMVKKYKKVKITDKFNDQFCDFDFVSKKAVQNEAVEILEAIDRLGEDSSLDGFSHSAARNCCTLM